MLVRFKVVNARPVPLKGPEVGNIFKIRVVEFELTRERLCKDWNNQPFPQK